MDKDVFIGNLTTVVKAILLTTGVPAIVSFANSNEFTLIVSALFGLAWAYFDAKYSNSFFGNNKSDTVINDIDPANEYEEMLNNQYNDDEGA